ncbi:DUF3906 family protein [Mesobacillus harenae]|uniref:DUF3906 family protein n=1 Tax=Mesobacillus harenae TaxID=2213203 RepID=UPI001580B191|nr:DUF3906 family protein [Mesobacillus harenae]
MAYLYRFEVTLTNKEITAVVYADNDDLAFNHLDVELEKFYLQKPDIKETTLREKKRVVKNSGFIIDEDEKGW